MSGACETKDKLTACKHSILVYKLFPKDLWGNPDTSMRKHWNWAIK